MRKGHLSIQAGIKRKRPDGNCQGVSLQWPSSGRQAFQKHCAGLVCKPCQVSFSTLFHLKNHCEGQTHKGKLLQLKKIGTPLSNPLCCELCNAFCSSGPTLEQHLKGTKHASCLQEIENAKQTKAQALAANSR
ncbi:unnamed protein product [Ilex paraguariensis]|uniref:C2H2-type domain-containing protein n=1 Tax=Ilex paraguariensis TaxID=185542 RepID=A0ABC8RDK8_9AQUA